MTSHEQSPSEVCTHSDFFVSECIARQGCTDHRDLHVGPSIRADVFRDQCADCGVRPVTDSEWWWTLGNDTVTVRICQPCADLRTADTKPRDPGLYADIPDTTYHADRTTLSSSGARQLLPPSTPAEFRWNQDHPRIETKAFDHGHAAHALVLGVGAELREIPAGILASNGAVSTKDAKAFVAKARADGAVPLKPVDYRTVHDMAASIRSNPLAAALLAEGQAEVSGYWIDPDTGVTLRFRPDWATIVAGQLYLCDLKTTPTAYPRAFGASAAKYGYHVQDRWYVRGATELGMHDHPEFLFIVLAKTPPYTVSVVRLDTAAQEVGTQLMRQAIDLYAHCTERGEWPAYEPEIYPVSLPKWATYEFEEITAA